MGNVSIVSRRTGFLHFITAGKRKWVLLIIVVALVGLRIALPFIVKSYVNATLAGIPGYRGHIDGVTIALWRGAYVIKGLKIETATANIPVPFVSASRIDLSIDWTAIFRGSLVGKIRLVDPKLNFVQGATAEDSQNGGSTDFLATLKKLFPFRIDRLDAQNGEVHFLNLHADPPVDIHLDAISLVATNLTNSNRLSKSLVASVDVKATAMGSGKLAGHMDIDPYAAQPTFSLNVQLQQFELSRLNAFLDAYVAVDVKSGIFEMYSEVAAEKGKFVGYVKPLFKDVQILRQKKDPPLKVFWNKLVAVAMKVFTNPKSDKVATKIPISGAFDAPKADILSTIGGILKNAFVTALQPGIEDIINLGSVPAT